MRKIIAGISLAMLMAVGMMLNFAPDTLALLIIGLMTLVMAWGYFFGMLPTAMFITGFRTGRQNMMDALEVQASSPWLSVQNVDGLFRQKDLDRLFSEYRTKVNQQEKDKHLVSDIAEFINEDGLALRSWQSVVQQIPSTLTAMGLLGTFIGLIVGISGIGFSSVEAAMSSIELLLSGIQTAFYTSIAGVIFSILFNLVYRLLWNSMLREMGMFIEQFHRNVLPSMEDQLRDQNTRDTRLILEKLERLPKGGSFTVTGVGTGAAGDAFSEQKLMPQIRDGLLKGEFVFFLQPRYDLNTKKIVAGEATIRWDHGEMGLISPSYFLPLVERNGFIVRLDQYIWDSVCKTIRNWIDSGIRPIPISVNVTKTDILAIDLVDYFDSLVRKYRIPPRYMEVEIAQNAYLESEAAAQEVEMQLRQRGFRVIVDGLKADLAELSVLKNASPDAVKLDLMNLRSPSDQINEQIKAAFDKMKMMDCTIMALGVANAEQVSILRSCGCAEGQGPFFCKPISLDEFETLTGHKR